MENKKKEEPKLLPVLCSPYDYYIRLETETKR